MITVTVSGASPHSASAVFHVLFWAMRYTSARQKPCAVGSGSPSRGEIRPNSVKETGKASFKFRDFDVRPLVVISEMTIIKDHKMTDLSVDQIVAGDVLVVLPHEICPVDGDVIEGYGDMDGSYLTGEPSEISKAPGSAVLSGAINGEAALRIRATRVPADSRYARVVRVVEDAERKRPPMRRVADRLGAWYTPLALTIAGGAWLAGGTSERFLAVLVIATPCPLLIAIPVVIIGGISLAAKRGIVIRNPAALEQLDCCRTSIFDKTGTLTYGRPLLAEIVCVAKFDELTVLRAAASLEQYSRHPLAQAILDSAKTRRVALFEVINVSERPGQGLSGTIRDLTVQITGRNKVLKRDPTLAMLLPPVISGLECLIFINGELAAVFLFHEAPREESRPFVRHLGRMHRATKVILLSGDRQSQISTCRGRSGVYGLRRRLETARGVTSSSIPGSRRSSIQWRNDL